MSCNDPELRYMLHTPAGAEYVRQIGTREEDRLTRSAFRDLAVRIAAPGARLFDFGAGPGTDARFFAEHGFTVDAYDVDPRMRDFFADHCRDHIGANRIHLETGTYRDFLARRTAASGRCADLILSNFAPLNLVDNLHALFAKFAALSGPHARILASVLNPCFLGDMRAALWWRALPQLLHHGEHFLPGPQAPYHRRLLRHFRNSSADHFQLLRVFAGRANGAEFSDGIDAPRRGRFEWLHLARCRYLFLLFQKTEARS